MDFERITSPQDMLWENPFKNAVVVEEDEWKPSDAGILTTARATSCSIVAIHDPVKRRGYLGHFKVEVDMAERKPFKEMMGAIKSGRPSKKLEAWVSGASTLDLPKLDKQHLKVYHELIELNKSDTLKHLRMLGAVTIGLAWLRENERITGVVFDAANGTIDYGVNKINT